MANPATQPNMGYLKVESQRLINNALSDNSNKAYNSALKKFHAFAQIFGIAISWPLPLDIILNFIAYLSLQHMSPNTVQLYIRALAYFHKVRQVSDPTASFLVAKALQGLARGNTAPDTRYPITLPILEKLLAYLPFVCTSSFESTLFASAFSLAYFGLLRVGEFTLANSCNSRYSHCIQFQHVTLGEESKHVTFTIPHSKTDQTGKKTTIFIRSQPHSIACPVHSMRNFLAIRPHTSDTHCLFIHSNAMPLTRFQFNAVLQKAIQAISTPGHFGTHSFRIGRATDLALQGFSDQQIQTFGRWKSLAFQKYIRM